MARSKAVFCITRSDFQAAEVVSMLRNAGFQNEDIAVLLPDRQGTRDFAHEKGTKAPEGGLTGAGAGGVTGGVLGWLVGAGALAIPGLGPFIAAGPILAALSGAAVGATVGGLAGTLVGLGIPEYEAKRYEGKLKEGNSLISVHVDSSEDQDRVKKLFQAAGATDISTGKSSTI